MWRLLAMGTGWIACGESPPSAPVAWGIEPLTAEEQLVRASMAVRGVRPSVTELDDVASGRTTLDALLDGWLASEEYGDTIEDMHAELYLLRADTNYQLPVMGPLVDAGYNQADIHVSTTSAPTRLVREVVLGDAPYTEILTADDTIANDVVAAIYGLPYDPAGPEWQHTTWVDGRPQSGLLSDSEMWRRHVSNAANFHRGRANFVSRAFLCEDIGARDVFVAGGVDIADEFAVAEAVSTQTGCVGCHNVIDPLAAFFWGYKEQLQRNAVLSAYELGCEWDWSLGEPPLGDYRVEHWCYPLKFYDVAEEDDWAYWHLHPPGYFGQPADTMEDLGELIVSDPRFATCTARTFAGYLTQTPREDLPDDWITELAGTFVASGFSAKALTRAVVTSEAFGAARVPERTNGAVADGERPFVAGLQSIRPEQLSRAIADLTGFTWQANQDYPGCEAGGNNCWGAVDLVTTDVYGFRAMLGGVDSYTVLRPTHTPTPTKLLALAKLADEAAGYVVLADAGLDPGSRRLFTVVDPSVDADEATVRAQIAALFLRVLGERRAVDDPDVDAVYALWTAAALRASDPAEGWRVTVSTLFRDPRMVTY